MHQKFQNPTAANPHQPKEQEAQPVSYLSALVSNLNVFPPDPFRSTHVFISTPTRPAPIALHATHPMTRPTPLSPYDSDLESCISLPDTDSDSDRYRYSPRSPRFNTDSFLRLRYGRSIQNPNPVTRGMRRVTRGRGRVTRGRGTRGRGGRGMHGFTENGSATFVSSGNPCLDFFFHVVPDTPARSVNQWLRMAWDYDPLKALKLMFNLRGVRGTGKSDKRGFYSAAMWLHKHHPRTLAGNLGPLVQFGYFKDLPEILFRILGGVEVRKRKRPREETSDEPAKELSREEKKKERAKKVVERIERDSNFKFLDDCVSDVFADHLRSDLKKLDGGDLFNISLAAKWCPSLDSSYDQFTILCEAIARKVFPREEYGEYEGVEEAHYAYRVRDRLRKEVLVPLRRALELPEVYMGAYEWGLLRYNRVASVSMSLNKDKFMKHDKDRFVEYLEKVKAGKAKIAAGALLPHQIIKGLDDDEDGSEVAELQWKQMVDDVAKNGKFRNCLAISDVSGSMHGIPMEVSVALGVLVSELSEEPWRGKLITFSKTPQLQVVEGDTLKEKTEFVKEMDWGMNTDFQAVFDLILDVAVRGRLQPDEMIKKLFVFSDMEFDEASANPWKTDYEVIVSKFRKSGYGDCVPEIVFWNLRDSTATPVVATQKGVALVSGFSKNLMTLFLGEGCEMSPEAVMDAAISGEEYQQLVVLD